MRHQIGRITFGPRVDSFISKFRGIHHQGDVEIPLTPTKPDKDAQPWFNTKDLCDIVEDAMHGEAVDNEIEKILNDLRCYGSCEQSGSECINPTCRCCASVCLKSNIKHALLKDIQAVIMERLKRMGK